MRFGVVGSSKQFFSGLTTHTIFLCNALAARGHEVCAVPLKNIAPRFVYPGRDRVGKGQYVVNFRPEVRIYDGVNWNSPRSWFGAAGFLNDHRPDAVIMLWWSSTVLHMELSLALGVRRCPLILEMHEVLDPLEQRILPLRWYSRLAGGILMRRFDAFTVPSPSVADVVAQAYPIAREKVQVVPIGLYERYAGGGDRETARREMGLDGFVILYFGMIRRYKGVPQLVKAFTALPDEVRRSCCLVIAGEDWGDDRELAPLVAQAACRSRIVFSPAFVPDDKVAAYFAAADVVVLPYLRSCGSGVGQIAVSQGKPLITSDIPSLRESFGAYSGIRLFAPGDVGALKDELLAEYGLWRRGDATRHGGAGFSWDEVALRYEEMALALNHREGPGRGAERWT